MLLLFIVVCIAGRVLGILKSMKKVMNMVMMRMRKRVKMSNRISFSNVLLLT